MDQLAWWRALISYDARQVVVASGILGNGTPNFVCLCVCVCVGNDLNGSQGLFYVPLNLGK